MVQARSPSTNINSPVTRAIFSAPGTYVLRLTANDTHRLGTDDIQVTVNASPALVGATLQLAAVAAGPYVTGTPQSVRATLRNSAGNPLANFGVEFTVTGPNATTGSGVTNASGIATFTYAGTNPGTDTVTALVRSTATANVNGTPPISMVWTLTPQSPPVTQGWIGGPLNGSTLTGTIPITVGAGHNVNRRQGGILAGNKSVRSDHTGRQRAGWSRRNTRHPRHHHFSQWQLRHPRNCYQLQRQRTSQPGHDHRHR